MAKIFDWQHQFFLALSNCFEVPTFNPFDPFLPSSFFVDIFVAAVFCVSLTEMEPSFCF